MNFVCFNTTWYQNFPPSGIVCLGELAYGFGSVNDTMSLSVVANPHELFVGDSKVDTRNWTLIAPFQLPEPLMG